MTAFTCPWCGKAEPNDMLLRNNARRVWAACCVLFLAVAVVGEVRW